VAPLLQSQPRESQTRRSLLRAQGATPRGHPRAGTELWDYLSTLERHYGPVLRDTERAAWVALPPLAPAELARPRLREAAERLFEDEIECRQREPTLHSPAPVPPAC
jgi:hypothetical protein